MALFRTRNSSDNKSEPATRKKSASVDTVETLRTRARQRLIGSALLLLAGIITFTLLFDSKPRPIPTDIEIIIPDKDKVAPISAPTQTPAQAPAQTSIQASPPSTPSQAVAEPAPTASSVKPSETNAAGAKTVQASSSLDAKEELVTSKPAVKAAVKPEPKTPVKIEPKIDPQTTSKTNLKPTAADDGAKAKAILEGKDPNATTPSNSTDNKAVSGTDRYIVQVGAFADAAKARDVRLKVEQAGLKTYTHVAKTPEGTRTRVRVGPFANRAEADKAAEKIKKLDLPAAILTL